ncbi:hypothetical protein RF11_08212 [Thelohanellus kitauei]|uniref:EGF-like domain-containing protein n=1 Tax=Thelohanellus kitauei TaxID=669202 RepID=A0A0C2N2J3_THEKT|nr:hypothetical protein RF11_08212 [Thelohanellus kitauei]
MKSFNPYANDKIYVYSSDFLHLFGLRVNILPKNPRVYIYVSFHIFITLLNEDIGHIVLEIEEHNKQDSRSLLHLVSTINDIDDPGVGQQYYLWAAFTIFDNSTKPFQDIHLKIYESKDFDPEGKNIMPDKLYDSTTYIYHKESDDFNITLFTKIECDDITDYSSASSRDVPRCCNNFGIHLDPHPNSNLRCGRRTCVVSGDSRKCNCTQGYNGTYCEISENIQTSKLYDLLPAEALPLTTGVELFTTEMETSTITDEYLETTEGNKDIQI